MLRNLIELIEQKLLLEINIIILGRVFFFFKFFRDDEKWHGKRQMRRKYSRTSIIDQH